MHGGDVPGTLVAAARRYPQREAAVGGYERLTYTTLLERVSRLAAGLRGVEPRHARPVAVLSDNSLAYLELYYAVVAAGAILVPLNTRLAPTELAGILRDADVRSMFVGPGLEQRAAEINARYPIRVISMPGASEQSISVHYADLLAAGPGKFADCAPDDIAYLYYTSGTSGRPKGVPLTHRNVLSNALSTAAAVGITERDVWLHAGPMFHLADAWAVWALTWLGGRHVLERFKAERTVATIERERITLTLLVPTAVELLADAAAAAATRLPGLRGLLYGGAPASRRVLEKVRDNLDAPLVHTYGSTETAGTLSVLPAPEHGAGPGAALGSCVGRETPLVEIKVGDGEGREIGHGEVGEILVRGPMVTAGYLGHEELSRAALAGGFYRTGDLGYRDENGALWLVGRGTDMIITGGENVYPGEIERVLLGMDQIAEVAVVGIAHPRWTEEVTAFVVLRPGAQLSLGELRAHAGRYLGGYKIPRTMRIVDELSKNGAGKVDRAALRGGELPFEGESVS
ncbi:MAG TPA: AMP-binding protein [Pseudonocardia sp.]|nr:AMP-binding protein [Pseudonocardia sp.]